jgi:hypothetical protein
MQKIIQIYPCLLKLSCKQESMTDGRTLLLYPSPLSLGDNKQMLYTVNKHISLDLYYFMQRFTVTLMVLPNLL